MFCGIKYTFECIVQTYLASSYSVRVRKSGMIDLTDKGIGVSHSYNGPYRLDGKTIT